MGTSASKFVLAAVATVNSRPVLTYALRNGRFTVAVDGWRLHVETDISADVTDTVELIPTKHSDKHASGKETARQYPMWSDILPTYFTHTFTCMREELLHAVTLARAVSQKNPDTIVLAFRGETCSVIGKNLEFGDCETAVYAPENKGYRTEFEISFQGALLHDALKLMTGELIEIGFAINDAISISNDLGTQQALIMPMTNADGVARRDVLSRTMTASATWWTETVPALYAELKARTPKAPRKPKPAVKPHEPAIIEYRNGAGCPIVEYRYDPLAAAWQHGDWDCSLNGIALQDGLCAANVGNDVVFWHEFREYRGSVWNNDVHILRRAPGESFLEQYTYNRWGDKDHWCKLTNSITLPVLSPADLADMFARFARYQPIHADMPTWVSDMVTFANQPAPIAAGAA